MHGRPDWWRGVIPGKDVFGVGQSSWYEVQEVDLAGGATSDLINYLVASDTILHLTAGLICCNAPGIQRCAMNFSPALLGNIYYDSLLVLPLNPVGTYEITEGNTIYVQVENLDDIEHHFTVSLLGFEELA